MANKTMRRNLLCLGIDRGIIGVVTETGDIESYAQRGLRGLSLADRCYCIECGAVSPKAFELKELPRNVSIHFEEPSIMGKPRATFNMRCLFSE